MAAAAGAAEARRRRCGAAPGGLRVLALPLLLLLLAAARPVRCERRDGAGGRRLLLRPFPGGVSADLGLTCRNTLLGPYAFTDDKGVLCRADDLDRKTGCCRRGEKNDCATCSLRDRCCDGYEACVSCCLRPGHGAEERLPHVYRVPGRKSTGAWSTAFELCAAVCKTHRYSTAHENSYISPRHHCFSKLGKPLLSPPLPPHSLDGVTVVMGAPGSSCDAACERHGRQCSREHLRALDSCDRLRESVACEAGCVAEAPTGPVPFYADGDAPKADRPALCVASDGGRAAEAATAGGGSSSYTCRASQPHMRRLCPCVSAPAGGRAGAAAAEDRKSVV